MILLDISLSEELSVYKRTILDNIIGTNYRIFIDSTSRKALFLINHPHRLELLLNIRIIISQP